MEKMRGVKVADTPVLTGNNSEFVKSARKARKSGGRAKEEKMEGAKSAKRGDRSCRSNGGPLADSNWTAAQGLGKNPRK